MIPLESLWLLLLIAAVACIAFFAGWSSSSTYLNAANAVAKITAKAVDQSNQVGSALDKVAAEQASLRETIARVEARLGDVNDGLTLLFQGFERAGLVRSSRSAPGPMVGEKPGE